VSGATVIVSEDERWTVLNALTTAREVYKGHAALMRDQAARLRRGEVIGLWAEGEAGAVAADRMAEQFESQVLSSEAVYDLVENIEQVIYYAEETDESTL
jgi:hypothetical protein